MNKDTQETSNAIVEKPPELNREEWEMIKLCVENMTGETTDTAYVEKLEQLLNKIESQLK